MLATIVDGAALVRVIWVSLAAGIGLTLVFSAAIAAGSRAGQCRRSGATVGAVGWYVATGACALLCTAAVVLGVIVMLSK
jgi:hypothetical protein